MEINNSETSACRIGAQRNGRIYLDCLDSSLNTDISPVSLAFSRIPKEDELSDKKYRSIGEKNLDRVHGDTDDARFVNSLATSTARTFSSYIESLTVDRTRIPFLQASKERVEER